MHSNSAIDPNVYEGDAIFVRGITWASAPTSFRTQLDDEPLTTHLGGSSSLSFDPNSPHTEQLVFDLMYYFNAGLDSSKLYTFIMDNNEGVGKCGIDYIEVVSVSGGTK